VSEPTTESREQHWDSAYVAGRVSWQQANPVVSLELIDALAVGRDAAVVDVGGGTSTLADRLLERGFRDVTVLDISAAALDKGRTRLAGAPVTWLQEDLLAWRPERRFDLWHDRAVFHFLVTPAEQDAYLRTLCETVPGGFLIMATFAADGPDRCSGLPVARYSVEALREALGPGFELLETRREEHVTPGGVVQPFTWVAGRMHPGR
jgi:SAM-dependent methyltransferase